MDGKTKRRAWVLAGALALGVAWCGRGDEAPTLGTFNMLMFPRLQTDRDRVVQAFVELDASVVAVQEIKDPHALWAVLWHASERMDRDYRLVMARCGANGAEITTGLVWDASRVRLVGTRDFPALQADGGGGCQIGVQAALLGVFEDADEHRFGVLTVHLSPFPERFDTRKAQWQEVLRILADAREQLGIPVVALGDYNTTGFRGEPQDERAFVERVVADAGYTLPTADLECTEYWQPHGPDGEVVPSILDHAVATDGRWTAEPLGMCARLHCEPRTPATMDPDYTRVSDHCPVRLTGRW